MNWRGWPSGFRSSSWPAILPNMPPTSSRRTTGQARPRSSGTWSKCTGSRRLFHVDGPPTAPDAHGAQARAQRSHAGAPWRRSRRLAQRAIQRAERRGSRREAACRPRALPDAIVCANDQMAIGVLQALARGGVRVPEELSVTGFDDIFPGSLFEPVAHHRAPAHAAAGRAGLRPAARPHSPAGLADAGGIAADRPRAAQELRLPARHRSANACPATPCHRRPGGMSRGPGVTGPPPRPSDRRELGARRCPLSSGAWAFTWSPPGSR